MFIYFIIIIIKPVIIVYSMIFLILFKLNIRINSIFKGIFLDYDCVYILVYIWVRVGWVRRYQGYRIDNNINHEETILVDGTNAKVMVKFYNDVDESNFQFSI